MRSPLIRCTLLLVLLLLATGRFAGAQIAVIGSTVEEHTAAVGETYSGSIVVRNLTQQPQQVRIYQTDYRFFADGTSHFEEPGTTPRSNAKWITPTAQSLNVPASSEMSVAYTVKVPADSALAGTYWSTIMIEGAPLEPGRPTSDRPQVGIGAVMRYAVQVATHVGGSGSRTLAFANSKFVTNADSTLAFEADVQNTGERAYRPALWIEVYDAQGTLRANARQERGLLYPGTSLKQVFALGRLPSGTYRAVLFADSGEDTVFAAQYTLKF